MPKQKLSLGVCQSRLGLDPMTVIREAVGGGRTIYFRGSYAPTASVPVRECWVAIDAAAFLQTLRFYQYPDLNSSIDLCEADLEAIITNHYPRLDESHSSTDSLISPLDDFYLEVDIPTGGLAEPELSDLYFERLGNYAFTGDFKQCAFKNSPLWKFTAKQGKVVQILYNHRKDTTGGFGVSLDTLQMHAETTQKIVSIFRKKGVGVHRAYKTLVAQKERGFYYLDIEYVPTEGDRGSSYTPSEEGVNK